MSEKSLEEISGKLDKILKLLAVNTVKGLEKDQEKIELLDQLGFRPVEIAVFLGKSPDNINVQLSLLRKKKGKSANQPIGNLKEGKSEINSDKKVENLNIKANLEKTP